MDQYTIQTSKQKKIFVMAGLFILATSITLLGFALSIFSLINNISFTVLSSQIPGFVFGLAITFLGARYFLAVKKLKVEVFKEETHFSWSNFKKSNT
ncbi:hypothetical protein [Acetivibrio cellulolyticus]|uniref:hypothetical protein n=1 Tax=Acetivibrio cellulolyticus TaxID=35830 RepID=UPI0001E2FB6E|nr:hypothetical protein [Acetivibrio cellulolyticus]